MAAKGNVNIRIVADPAPMQKALRQTGSDLTSWAKKAAGAFAGLMIVDKVTDYVRESVAAASDLSETLNKSSVVFGKYSKDMENFGETAAKSLGMSKQQAIEAAATFGNLFVSMKMGQQPAEQMSKSLIQLAADLASFNNTDPTEALQALRSGLVGEIEPLRKYGVNLNDAILKQEAMNMGLYNGKGNLDASAKAMAAYKVIMDQTGTAQGDFARTADGLANSQRTLKAEVTDLKAKFGSALLPVVQQIIPWINKAVDAFGDLADRFSNAAREGGIFDGLAELFGGLGDLIVEWIDAIPWDKVGAALSAGISKAAELAAKNAPKLVKNVADGIVEGAAQGFFSAGQEARWALIQRNLEDHMKKYGGEGIEKGFTLAMADIRKGPSFWHDNVTDWLDAKPTDVDEIAIRMRMGLTLTAEQAKLAIERGWDPDEIADYLADQADKTNQKLRNAIQGKAFPSLSELWSPGGSPDWGIKVPDAIDAVSVSAKEAAPNLALLTTGLNNLYSGMGRMMGMEGFREMMNKNLVDVWEGMIDPAQTLTHELEDQGGAFKYANQSMKGYAEELELQLKNWGKYEEQVVGMAKTWGAQFGPDVIAAAAKLGPQFMTAFMGADKNTQQRVLSGLQSSLTNNIDTLTSTILPYCTAQGAAMASATSTAFQYGVETGLRPQQKRIDRLDAQWNNKGSTLGDAIQRGLTSRKYGISVDVSLEVNGTPVGDLGMSLDEYIRQNAGAQPVYGKPFAGMAGSTTGVWNSLKMHFPKAGFAGGKANRPYKSDHTTGHAFDTTGSYNYMNSMSDWLAANSRSLGIKYIIHNPRGIWNTSHPGWRPYIPAPSVRAYAGASAWHYDHVHVSTYDRGGFLPPHSATLAVNNTARPEPITTGQSMDEVVALLAELLREQRAAPKKIVTAIRQVA